MARTPLVAGNWKMNNNHIEATGLVQKLSWALIDGHYQAEKSEAAVIVPFTDIRSVQTLIEGDKLPLAFGAQDVSLHDSGAYTGEIAAGFLSKLSCKYVVVGHSERRQYHGETDEIVNAKAKKVIEAGMTPIICVGESLETRKAGHHLSFVVGQTIGVLAGLTPEQVGNIVIAYEPVWAIGTGEVATSSDAQEVCGAIRNYVASEFGYTASENLRIQYGGSVKSSNMVEIMSGFDVDGALVGGASLDAEEFARIVLFYQA